METIHIQKTKASPEIIMDFSKGTLDISGESYPENAMSFYKPLFEWLKTVIDSKKQITINFKLDYFNTSTSKCVIDILDMVDKYHTTGGSVKINWYYKEDDDDMMETGEEFSSDLKAPFEILSY